MNDADSRSAYYDSGVWLGAVCGTLVGVAMQMQQARLWTAGAYLACALLGAVAAALGLAGRYAKGGAVLRGRGTSAWRRLGFTWALVAVACGAWALTGCRAQARLSERLSTALEGRPIVVEGVVDGLPEVRARGVSFFVQPGGAWLDGEPVRLPRHISLFWPAGTRQPASLPVKSGQTWRFTARLTRPEAPLNPGGFDLSLWWLEQNVGAVGFVQANGLSPPLLVADTRWAEVDRWRQALRDRIDARVPDARAAGVLAALALGDQSAIDREDWGVFRDTGVAHLMSISGLHITMFAWLSAALAGWGWRRSLRLMAWWPAPRAAAALGVACAAAYSWFAGWGVPAQRTVLMLAVVTGLRAGGRHWPAWWVLGVAAAAVLWWDPWAWEQAGFWLSFVAVGVLMTGGASGASDGDAAPDVSDAGDAGNAAGAARALEEAEEIKEAESGGHVAHRARWRSALLAAWRRLAGAVGHELKEGARTQTMATFSLAPLSLAFFQQISLVGLLANIVTIPWVSFVVTPLALLGALWPALWDAAAWAVRVCVGFLHALASLSHAVWVLPPAPGWAVVAATLGFGLLLSPLPARLRLMGLPLVLPLFATPAPVPPPGQVDVVVFDTTPAHWVLVRTAHHALLWGDESAVRHPDADPQARLADLLRPLGVTQVDTVLSTRRWTKGRVKGDASTRPTRAPWPQGSCGEARLWRWDEVEFKTSPAGLGHERGEGGCALVVNALRSRLYVSTQAVVPLDEGSGSAHARGAASLIVLSQAAWQDVQDAWPRRDGTDMMYLAGSPPAPPRGHDDATQRASMPRPPNIHEPADCGALSWTTAPRPQAGAREAVCEKQRQPRYWREGGGPPWP